jgi:hypothetical protein
MSIARSFSTSFVCSQNMSNLPGRHLWQCRTIVHLDCWKTLQDACCLITHHQWPAVKTCNRGNLLYQTEGEVLCVQNYLFAAKLCELSFVRSRWCPEKYKTSPFIFFSFLLFLLEISILPLTTCLLHFGACSEIVQLCVFYIKWCYTFPLSSCVANRPVSPAVAAELSSTLMSHLLRNRRVLE